MGLLLIPPLHLLRSRHLVGAHFFLCVSESSGVDKLRAKQEKGKDHVRHGQNHDSEMRPEREPALLS